MTQSKLQGAQHRLQRLANYLAPIMGSAGLGIDEVTAAFERAFAQTGPQQFGRPSVLDIDSDYARCIGAMLSLWRSELDYVDERGDPIALTASGPSPSLQSLYATWAEREPERAAKLSSEKTVQLIIDHGVATAADGGGFLPTQSWFRVNTNEALMSGALLDYLARFACSIRHSLDQDGQPYFNSHVSRFPVDKLPILERRVTEDGVAWLESVDAWLERKNLPPESNEKSVHAGVGLFMFFEDED